MKIVLFWFNKYQKKIFWNNKNFIFFDERGWWILSNGKRKNYKINHFVKKKISETKFDFLRTVKKIKMSSSVWNRHNSRGDKYEQLIRKATITSYNIYETLNHFSDKKKNIAFFNTGVSHHLDTEICDIASTLSGWKKYYFYFDIFSGRLIPLKVGENINKRTITKIKFSNFMHNESIDNFIRNESLKLKPKYNSSYSNIDKLFWFSIFKIFLLYKLKSFLNSFIKNILFKKKKNIFEFAYKKFPFQDVIQTIEQKKALNFLQKNTEKLSFKKRSLILVILANYQPEATTTPEGFKYQNYIDLVFNIRKLGFTGNIYYKEHDAISLYTWFSSSTQVSNFRSKSYYQQLKSFGCKFISTKDYEKIKNSNKFQILPITINGTIAIERSLKGYYTIIAGSPWFRKMPGIINFSGIKSLNKIPMSMLKKNNQIAIKSKKYLLKNLNYSTLTNLSGIGSGKKNHLDDDKLFNSYKSELLNFIRKL
tara:strand:+ start:19412 stop:20851 length:1440 start_codon:yes stop_codon:yes gene_type:complete